jgi:hypothetical protein
MKLTVFMNLVEIRKTLEPAHWERQCGTPSPKTKNLGEPAIAPKTG